MAPSLESGRRHPAPLSLRSGPARRAACVLLLAGCSVVDDTPSLVLDGASVFTAVDTVVTPNQRIVIQNGHIVAIGAPESIELPRGADVRDLTGKWIIPGLIDAHTQGETWSLNEFVAWGVTTIRDLHSDSGAASALKARTQVSDAVTARVLTAGGRIDGSGSAFPGATEVSNDREARRAVGARALGGAEWVAVYTRLTSNLLRSVHAEAAVFRMPIAASLGAIDAVTAARLGVRTIEGLTGVIEATAANRAYWARAHRDYYEGVREVGSAWATARNADLDRVAERLAASGVFLVPTLIMHESFAHLGDTLDLIDNTPLNGVPGFVRTRWNVPELLQRVGWADADFLALRAARQRQDRFVATFTMAGGTVVAGTGATRPMVPPGVSLHREMELLTRADFTPADALLTATRNAAEALSADSLGTIAIGSVADLVVLDADPTASISNTRRIAAVVIRGEYLSPAEIRQRRP